MKRKKQSVNIFFCCLHGLVHRTNAAQRELNEEDIWNFTGNPSVFEKPSLKLMNLVIPA